MTSKESTRFQSIHALELPVSIALRNPGGAKQDYEK